MITARIEPDNVDFFVRDRVRVIASYDVGRDRFVLGRTPDGNEYAYRVSAETDDGPTAPEGTVPYVLDARTDVAHAVYLALKERFEPKDAVPTIADTAYRDARADLQRAHALIDKLVDAVTQPPTQVLTELMTSGSESRP